MYIPALSANQLSHLKSDFFGFLSDFNRN